MVHVCLVHLVTVNYGPLAGEGGAGDAWGGGKEGGREGGVKSWLIAPISRMRGVFVPTEHGGAGGVVALLETAVIYRRGVTGCNPLHDRHTMIDCLL